MNRYKLKDISLSKLEYGSGAAACEYDGKTRYVRITDIDNEGNLGMDVVSPNSVDDKYLLNDGDVLFARTGATVGKTYLYRSSAGRCIYAGFLIRVVPNQKIIRPDYLYYFTKSPQYKGFVQSSMKIVAQPNINAKQYGDLEFNVPSLEEQDLIIKKLNTISSVIILRRTELMKLDELIKARFVEMFYDKGYPVLKWNDVFNTTTGKLDSNAAVDGGAYPFFTCSKEVLRIDDYAFEEEALLLAGNNAAGKYDVKYYSGKFNAYQRTYVLTLKENWSYRLFQYQLEDKLAYLQQQSLGGLTKYLTLKILGELEFIISPKKQQDKFDLFIKQVDKSKVAVQKALDDTQLLFNSLMQKYFG